MHRIFFICCLLALAGGCTSHSSVPSPEGDSSSHDMGVPHTDTARNQAVEADSIQPDTGGKRRL